MIFYNPEKLLSGKDKREITLLVEELALCYPEKTQSAKQQSFKQLINVGRHYGVNIIVQPAHGRSEKEFSRQL